MEQVRDVAQSVEYTSGGREVARSNRVIPTRLQGSPLQPFLFFPPPSSLFSFPSFPSCSSPSSFLSFLIPRPVFPSWPSMAALCSPSCPRGGRPLFPSVFRGGRVWPPHLRPASRCCSSHLSVPIRGRSWPPFPQFPFPPVPVAAKFGRPIPAFSPKITKYRPFLKTLPPKIWSELE